MHDAGDLPSKTVVALQLVPDPVVDLRATHDLPAAAPAQGGQPLLRPAQHALADVQLQHRAQVVVARVVVQWTGHVDVPVAARASRPVQLVIGVDLRALGDPRRAELVIGSGGVRHGVGSRS
jgi:hypothetical protein